MTAWWRKQKRIIRDCLQIPAYCKELCYKILKNSLFNTGSGSLMNETVGHGHSGHPILCPVLRLVSRVVALRQLHASPSTSINAYRDPRPGRPFQYVLPIDITRRLRATLAIHPDPAIDPRDISARSTRAGGAMALLCAGVDRDRIKLVGRWRSEELYRYLHVQAQQIGRASCRERVLLMV